ncbi:MAG: indolepyruvate ferredoxin oxidoreductase subunit alpha [Candidatus Hodarchaeales archaeon]|jgi:indolepyruvate ferredoxin oxidoreductase alpha subunit
MTTIKQLLGNETIVVLGNEAVVRGALEAGLQFFASYPGTPVSEIGEVIALAAQEDASLGLYVEWSVNEAVALEAAFAASLAGRRSMFTAKHVGFNVAMDALMTIAYEGCRGGLVLVTGDDPSMHSSQNEQDNRWLGTTSGIPVLEPSDAQESQEFTKVAFDLSERYETPVILRMTTRVSHSRSDIKLNPLSKVIWEEKPFEKDPFRLVSVPGVAKLNHPKLVKKKKDLVKWGNQCPLNRVEGDLPSEVGLITSGVSYSYIKETLRDLEINVPILKLGIVSPLPEQVVADFLRQLKRIIVIEEVDPFLETHIKALATEINYTGEIIGKKEGLTPYVGELNTRAVTEAIQTALGIKQIDVSETDELVKGAAHLIPNRPPILCPGCPHSATFYALNRASRRKVLYCNDIGCYALGIQPPHSTADTLVCMGGSIGMANGFGHARTEERPVAIIGDSTFWHSGLPGLVNAVYNQSEITILIVDNLTTAMTGAQDHPGTGMTAMGWPTKKLDIEEAVRGLGVDCVEIIDSYKMKPAVAAFKRALSFEGPSVVISRGACMAQITLRERRREGLKVLPFFVDHERCNGCAQCVDNFNCAAIYWSNAVDEKSGRNKAAIDPLLCASCTFCSQVCARKAIRKQKYLGKV